MSKLGTRHAVAEPGSEHSCPHAEASLRPRCEPSRGEWRPSHCLGSCEGTVQTHRHDGTRAERLASASPAVLVRTRAASPTPRAATRCASRRRSPRLCAEAGTALPSTEAGDGGRSGSLAFVFRPVPSTRKPGGEPHDGLQGTAPASVASPRLGGAGVPGGREDGERGPREGAPHVSADSLLPAEMGAPQLPEDPRPRDARRGSRHPSRRV